MSINYDGTNAMENSTFDERNNIFPITDPIPLSSNGSTSDIYKVRINGKWHFLKRPKKEYSTHPVYIAAFEKEFDVGFTLDHNNIVRYIGKAYDENGIYFLTEYVDGDTLTEFVKKHPTYFHNREHIERFISQILSALDYLHNKQILHLDLKPDNIIITSIGNNVKIVDLGFAYNDCYQFLTSGKSLKYAAPEQIEGGEIGQWTDIYALGVILLYVYTGSVDFGLLNRLPKRQRGVVKKCLKDDYTKRFKRIQEIKEILSKKRSLISIFLLITIIVGVIGALFLYLQTVNKKSVPVAILEDSTTSVSPQDTAVVEMPPITKDLEPTTNIVPKLSEKNLEEKIQKRIKDILVPFYTTYPEINDNNWQEASSAYSDKLREVFALVDVFALQTNKPSEEILAIVRKIGEKETDVYRLRRRTYADEKGRQLKNESEFVTQVVRELASLKYGEFYSRYTEMNRENRQEVILAYRAMRREIQDTIESIAKEKKIDRISFHGPWFIELEKNDSLYKQMNRKFEIERKAQQNREDSIIKVSIENCFLKKTSEFVFNYSDIKGKNFDEFLSIYRNRRAQIVKEFHSIALKENINIDRFVDGNPLFNQKMELLDSLYSQKIREFKSQQ